MLPSPQLLNQVSNFIQKRGKSAYFCLFLLGKEAGLRVSEAVNFDLFLKKSKNLYLISGKCYKKRHVFVDPTVINELKQYHWKPQQTNRFSYAHFLQKTNQELNISKDIELAPHTLRRCFATYQANSGMPLPVLKQVLGHSSIRTTALYWKNSDDSKEKLFVDKWLTGKLPQEPSKAIDDKPKELIKSPKKENNWQIFLNIHQKISIFAPTNPKNSEQKYLESENKLLQSKIEQLEQKNKEREQTINNLQNNLEKVLSDKENLTKQLIQVQSKKETLLNLLSVDLQKQQKSFLQQDNRQNIPKLHQQLTAQIQVLIKN